MYIVVWNPLPRPHTTAKKKKGGIQEEKAGDAKDKEDGPQCSICAGERLSRMSMEKKL